MVPPSLPVFLPSPIPRSTLLTLRKHQQTNQTLLSQSIHLIIKKLRLPTLILNKNSPPPLHKIHHYYPPTPHLHRCHRTPLQPPPTHISTYSCPTIHRKTIVNTSILYPHIPIPMRTTHNITLSTFTNSTKNPPHLSPYTQYRHTSITTPLFHTQ